MVKYYIQLAFEGKTFIRALRVAILVGIILNLINNPSIFFAFSTTDINILRILLTFLVPYCVSTYSSVVSKSNMKPGNISHLDALLKCKSCKKTNFHANIGQPIDECPKCKNKTRWKPIKFFSIVNSDDQLLKSLALFARYNPQPLFRIDSESVIIGLNPASESLLDSKTLNGRKLQLYFPEIADFDLIRIIKQEEAHEVIVSHSGKYFNLVLRGVPVLDTVHVYGNDITEIVLAEKKIKSQAREIQQSIEYACRIQLAMLPGNEMITQIFPKHFIFYRPRNIVSGDFYWVNKIGDLQIVAVADCTGHGVPGAFMSMMGISLLNEIILREKITSPSRILNILRERLILSLKTEGENFNVADGMDISLAVIDTHSKTLSFAGAYNPLFILRQGELIEIKADRMPVGEYVNDTISFSEKVINTQQNDRLILFTDGFKDQNGGEKNKKYSSRLFKKLLIDTAAIPMSVQLRTLEKEFDTWKFDHEQVDDVLVMGLEL